VLGPHEISLRAAGRRLSPVTDDLRYIADEAESTLEGRDSLTIRLVNPRVRRRIQHAVDRRFNRRRYDAARTIQGFGARLREQVYLNTLTVEQLGVVDQTMQPTQVSLWLRPSVTASQDQSEVSRPRPA